MEKILSGIQQLINKGLGAPLLVMVMLAMMVVPLPALMLDLLFTFNISLALVILLAGYMLNALCNLRFFPRFYWWRR